jgi:SPP1 gp7 family putative phage head morphogenesis protein
MKLRPPLCRPIYNVFCPTGEGGGIDPTCSPSGLEGSGSLLGKDKTSRQEIHIEGSGEDNKDESRLFITGYKKDSERTWLDLPGPIKTAELTIDLDPASKIVHLNRGDAFAKGKGYVREVIKHMFDKLAARGYEKATAYVQYVDSASQNMMAKLGGVRGKETDYGVNWHFDLKKHSTTNASSLKRRPGLRKPVPVAKLDPTRTGMVRRAFARKLRKAWARVAGELYKLIVKDDAFGLARRTTFNLVPVRTQAGDWQCGPASVSAVASHFGVKITQDEAAKLMGSSKEHGTDIADMVKGLQSLGLSAEVRTNPSTVPFIASVTSDGVGHWVVVTSRTGDMVGFMDPLSGNKEWSAKKFDDSWYEGSIIKQGIVVGKGTRNSEDFSFASSPEQLAQFQEWLRGRFSATVLGKSDRELWDAYIADGFKRGAGRAFDDTKKRDYAEVEPDSQEADWLAGSRQEFLRSAFGRPESVEKVQLLASRTFTDLENVTGDMATKLGRILADGLVAGENPRSLIADMDDQLDIGTARAETIARTEFIRAHAEGQLDALDSLGVAEIGVLVEWSTAGDDRVCPECEDMEGKTFSIEDAHGLIPAHPNCRCAFIPANVGETDKTTNRRAFNKFSADQPRVPAGQPGGGEWTSGGGAVVSTAEAIQQGKYKTVKELGGSTGAKLVEIGGKQYVMKFPPLSMSDHLRSEAEADNIYRAMGVKVPDGKLIETTVGPVKLTNYLDGAKELGSLHGEEKQAVRDEVAKNFVADALVGNWDVAGLNNDNIMKAKDGSVYRIDNGGALAFRAQGGKKGSDWGPEVKELETLRDPNKNPQAAKIYKNLTPDQINSQIKDVLSKKDAILAAATGNNKTILSQRLDYLQKKLGSPSSTPQVPTTAPAPTSAKGTPSHLSTADGIVAHLKANQSSNSKAKFTDLNLEKVKALNPDGIKNNTLYIAKIYGSPSADAKMAAQLEHLSKILPPEIQVKPKAATAKKLGIKGEDVFYGSSGATAAPKPAASKPAAPSPPPPVPQPVSTSTTEPKTYGELTPGYKYTNSVGKVKEVEDITHTAGKSYVKFKGEPGTATIDSKTPLPSKKSFPTPTPTFPTAPPKPPTEPGTKPWVPKPDTWKEGKVKNNLTQADLPEIKDGEPVVLTRAKLFDATEHKEWKDSLTREEGNAISSWKGSASGIRKEVATSTMGATSTAFMSAIEKSPTYDGLVYRGVSGPYAEQVAQDIINAGVGGTWSDASPHCTSVNPKTGMTFSAGQVMFRIRTKTGRPIVKADGFSSMDPNGETEVVGMPGTKYKITGIYKDVKAADGQTHTKTTIKHVIDLEEQ